MISVTRLANSLRQWRWMLPPLGLILLLLPGLSHGGMLSEIRMDTSVVIQSGKKVDSAAAAIMYSKGLTWCARECMLLAPCGSFNYRLSDLSCHLVVGSAHTGLSLLSDADFIYGVPDDFSHSLIGACAHASCPDDKKCELDIDGQTRCVLSRCKDPSPVPESGVTVGAGMVGSTVSYVCDNLWEAIGNTSVTCRTDGAWTPPQFHCRGLCVDSYPQVTNAGLAATLNKTFGSINYYACVSAGYKLTGSTPYTQCQTDHQWSTPSFSCITCPDPPTIANAQVLSGNNMIGSSRTYTCDHGYSMVGSASITCQSSATWSSVSFTCNAVPFSTSVTGSTGYLISPNYNSGYYAHNLNLAYTITPSIVPSSVSVTAWYEIHYTQSCVADYLTIGTTTRYCGTSSVSKTISVTTNILVNFVSDTSSNAKGFFLEFKIV